MSVFSELLAKSGLPEPSQKMIEGKLLEAFNLIVQNNERVAAVNAAKAQDPNNVEYLDALWASKAPTNDEMRPIEEQYQLLVAESEKLLVQLRDFAKTQVKPPLSEEETRKTRALVNESAPTITKAKQTAADMAMLADQMLELSGNAIPGGLISLMPEVESLKNTRGRKAAGSDGKIYVTRVGDVLLDGKSTQREINGEFKGKFNYAADDLSKMFGSDIFQENEVTVETLETAFYDALDKPFRSLKESEVPESFDFVFEKTVRVKNPNDDGFTEVPRKVKVTVKRKVAKPAAAETPKVETKSESTKTETPAPTKAPAKAPTKTETLKVSDHVKK